MGDRNEVRAGIQQAKLAEQSQAVLSFEMILIAAIAGGVSRSWTIGLVALVALVALVILVASRKEAVNAFSLFMGLVWGGLAGFVLSFSELGIIAVAILVGFAFMVGTGLHLYALETLNDFNLRDDNLPSAENKEAADAQK